MHWRCLPRNSILNLLCRCLKQFGSSADLAGLYSHGGCCQISWPCVARMRRAGLLTDTQVVCEYVCLVASQVQVARHKLRCGQRPQPAACDPGAARAAQDGPVQAHSHGAPLSCCFQTAGGQEPGQASSLRSCILTPAVAAALRSSSTPTAMTTCSPTWTTTSRSGRSCARPSPSP
jgi:hypothetical protein